MRRDENHGRIAVGLGQADEGILRETVDVLSSAAPRSMAFFVNRAGGGRRANSRGYYYSGSYDRTDGPPRLPKLKA